MLPVKRDDSTYPLSNSRLTLFPSMWIQVSGYATNQDLVVTAKN